MVLLCLARRHSLRPDVLKKIHVGHQGETKCILLARESVFWPGITNDIKLMVQRCTACAQHQQAQPKMPIQQPDLPTRAWSKLGTDIFEYKGLQFLIIVDYYSRLIRRLDNIRRVWGMPAHPDHDQHLESNLKKQQGQAYHYNQRHSSDKRQLHAGEPVDIYNTLTRSWDPGYIVSQQQERSYIVNRSGRKLPALASTCGPGRHRCPLQ